MDLTYKIIRSARKSIAIQIVNGEVLVRCPNRMAARDIQKFVESKAGWIQSHPQKAADRPRLPALTMEEVRELADRALTVIPARVAYFAPRIGVSYNGITIRNQRTRWGSCSSKGNLNFNCLLMLVPPAVLDYVVIHELCHRREMNHSPKFWAEVEKYDPLYRSHKKWLKDHGGSLIGRLP